MRPEKSLKRASAALIGSCAFVALLLIALPKKGQPPEAPVQPPKPAPKSKPLHAAKAAPKAAPEVAASTAADVDPAVALDALLTKTDAGAATREQLVERIVAIGPKVLPLIVGKVCGAAHEEPSDAETAGPDGDPQLDELRDAAMHDAIAKFDPAQQLACIVDRGIDASLDTRLVLVGLLGGVDHPDSVRELLAMVRPIEPIQWQREYVRNPVAEALSHRFSAHPEALPALRARLKDEKLELVAVIADACTRQPSSASVDLALSLLDRSPDLDAAVLHALACIDHAASLAIDETRLERLRHKLSDSEPEIRRTAAAVAGVVHDFDSVEALVGLLADPDRGVASAAHWSLRSMVRLDRGEDPAAWSAWLAERARWHTESAPELLAQLASDDAGEVVKSLSALLAEPQDRRELADAIAPLLAREDAAIFHAACTALGTLGSPRPLPELVSALASKDSTRREVAAASLRTLTGLDLPAKPAPWVQALGR